MKPSMPSFEYVYMEEPNLPFMITERHNSIQDQGCAFHWHEALEIYYVTTGGLLLNINGTEHQLRAGDIAVVGWGLPHRGSTFSQNTKHYILQIDLQRFPYLAAYKELQMPMYFQGRCLFRGTPYDELLQEIIMNYMQKNTCYDLTVAAGFMRFFSILISSASGQHTPSAQKDTLSHVHRILHYLQAHLSEKVALEDIALELGLSKPHMCRIFKAHTNQTIISYLNEQRCHLAASLILEGSSLTDACYRSGFEDYNYFSRTFRKVMYISPSEVIAINRD